MDGEQQLESDKILAQIEAVKAEAKTAQSTEEPKETSEEQTAVTEPEKEVEGKGTQAVETVVEKAPVEKTDKPDDDIRKWAEKKGIKDQDSALRSLRELERKLHKDRFEERRGNPRGQEAMPPQQGAQWQPQPQFQQPYAPPPSYPPYVDRDKLLEQEAAKRGWAKDDFEKVLELSSEIAAGATRKLKAEFDSQVADIRKETRRNSELNELFQDPIFRDERMQFEVHKVLEENPQAFAHEPMPYRYAFDEAQRRLARKYLEGEPQSKENPFPTNPPRDGSKSGGYEKKTQNDVLDAFSKAKTSEEQRKVLTSLGAIQSL